MLSINYRDPRPIYEQVRDSLGQLILRGAMEPGEKLPSVRSLAASLAINPNTIQRAYRELEQMGLIDTVAGKGAFVSGDGGAKEKRKQEILQSVSESLRELKLLGAEEAQVLDLVRRVYGEEEPK